MKKLSIAAGSALNRCLANIHHPLNDEVKEIQDCLKRNHITIYQWGMFLAIYRENMHRDRRMSWSYIGGIRDALWVMVQRKKREQSEIKCDYNILEKNAEEYAKDNPC